MSDFTIERSTSIVETDRRYSSVIRLHGTIDFPSKIKGGLLEVHIVRHGLPSNVDHIDKNHIGVGIFNFFPADTPELHLSTPGGFFDLQVAFAPAEFEEVVNMLLHWGSSPELTITLSADVAGLTPECRASALEHHRGVSPRMLIRRSGFQAARLRFMARLHFLPGVVSARIRL
ncbi:MAG: hypothetical protein Q8Q80_11960, partial [Methyloversatilis sp.]|uniref:hypothetical protein n=1 Tax=Methyloversatilis sp. TaxID=2569862 RepID=UPI002735D994